MENTTMNLNGRILPVRRLDVLVVGTGCAGYNAADRLYQYGVRDIAIVTDDRLAGTSRNTGSDKQTYYKLTLSGDEPDSVRAMAETYFAGQCMDGEHALCEAALSAGCFLHLCDLGVPFPRNRYGEYVGYKTDHDPRTRATSVGPLTSKQMTEALERSVMAKQIPILDHHMVIAILRGSDERAAGLLCLCTDTNQYELLLAGQIVYATGGPAGIYMDSCYPSLHHGMSGAAFEAGAAGKNLTEWQYGLASIAPRWNVSGTYMQVLPRFISTDQEGNDAREFLPDYLEDAGGILDLVFLKGYQWPFDVRKALNGSSLIDLIVYTESKVKGRRIFLDFRENPLGAAFSFDALGEEAHEYLSKTGALFGKPIDRLMHMNAPAVEFYRSKGVDLATEMLEIALCSQHNNGGLAIDGWWQSTVPGLFVCGEAAGSHGVYRPGGSALNAGQVGSERAASYIAHHLVSPGQPQDLPLCEQERMIKLIELPEKLRAPQSNLPEALGNVMKEMSRVGAAVRDREAIAALYQSVREKLIHLEEEITISSCTEAEKLYLYRDVLVTQQMYLYAMMDYSSQGGGSRGSSLYTDEHGQLGLQSLPETCRMVLDGDRFSARVQEVVYTPEGPKASWRDVHPIPQTDDTFENVWREWRESGNG